MKKHQRLKFTCGTALILSSFALSAFAQTDAAQVLFTSDRLIVIDAKGVERVVKQGDFVTPGERIITPPGGIGQIKLPDGTLISARPDSEFKIDKMGATAGKTILALSQGNLRVINADLPTMPKPLPVDVVTPVSTLQLTGGDGETIHVKSGNRKDSESGTYNRLQQGVAQIQTPQGQLNLQARQSGFVPRPDTLPTAIASLPAMLSWSVAPKPSALPAVGTTSTVLAPTLTTSILTSPTLLTGTTKIETFRAPTTTPITTTTAPTRTAIAPTLSTISQPLLLSPIIRIYTPPPPPPPKIILRVL